MKKKGFTLIELLAVIVILAIIALIATPIVMNVIENSRKGAAERSAENYIDAVETAVMESRIDGEKIEGEYTIDTNGNLTGNGLTEPLKIDMSGNKPTGGTIIIENGKVVTSLSSDATKKTTLSIGSDYTVSYDADGKIFATKGNEGNTILKVYRWSTDKVVNIGDELSSFTYVENSSDLGTEYYLKHIVENNLVTKSYVCTVFEGEEACVRGGNDKNGNSYYNENLEILKGLEDVVFDCYIGPQNSYCSDGYIYLNADLDGNVDAALDGNYCEVDANGISRCVRF